MRNKWILLVGVFVVSLLSFGSSYKGINISEEDFCGPDFYCTFNIDKEGNILSIDKKNLSEIKEDEIYKKGKILEIYGEESRFQDIIELKHMTRINPSEEIYSYDKRKPSFKIKIKNPYIPNAILKNLPSSIETSDSIYYLVQFKDDILKEEDYKEMLLNGIEFLDYIPDNTYVVKIPGNAKKMYNSIRWIGLLEADQKIDDSLEKYLSSDKTVEVTTELFESLDGEQLAKIEKISEKIINYGEDFVILEIKGNKIRDLAALDFAKSIYKYEKSKLSLDRSGKVISADEVWQSGNDASGITVGIIDSGIQTNHPHFSSINLHLGYDFCDGDEIPWARICNVTENLECERGTHGVHVAGIVSGFGNWQERTIRGISNKADLTIVRNYNETGYGCVDSDYEYVWKDVLDPDKDYDFNEASSADIISASWGEGYGIYDLTAKRADNVVIGEHSGGKEVLVVAAAGNKNIFNTVDSPCTGKNVLCVGASADFRASDDKCQHSSPKYPDGVPTYPNGFYGMHYTSLGTNMPDRRKPEILAPGSDITSSVLKDNYASWDGTSMATPHVSAVAAQILKEYSASPPLIKAMIIGSSYYHGSEYDSGFHAYTFGRLNAFSSIYKTADEYIDNYDENFVGNFLSGEPDERCYDVNVPSGADKIIAVMSYLDDSGSPPGGRGEVYNKIDLKAYKPDNSLHALDDNDHTTRKFIIKNPQSGAWKICVDVDDLNDLGGVLPKKVKYGIVMRVIKRTEDPLLNVKVNSDKTVVGKTDSFYINASVEAKGLTHYDTWAKIEVPAGLSLVSQEFDGTDSDKDVLGDIMPDLKKYSREWEITANNSGSYIIKICANATREDDVNIEECGNITINISECSCTSWQNQGCGLGGCAANKMQQTRTCTPPSCAAESRCVTDVSCEGQCSSNADCSYWWREEADLPALCDYVYNSFDGDLYDMWCDMECVNPGTPTSYCGGGTCTGPRLYEDCGYGCREDGICRDYYETITVCKDGSCQFNNIQDALNYSLPKDTVFITDGEIYRESVIWPNYYRSNRRQWRDIALDCNSAVLNGSGLFNKSYYWCYGGGDIIDLIGIYGCGENNIAIKNCEITGFNIGVDIPGLNIGVDVPGLNKSIIENNKIHNNNEEGLFLWGSDNNEITNNSLLYNKKGLFIRGKGNSIFKNNISFNDQEGIELLLSDSNYIEENFISNNGAGIYFNFYSDKSGNSLVNNTISSNGEYGIVLLSSYLNNFTNNIFCPSYARWGWDIFLISGNITNGYNNTCDKPGNWNDTGTTGCTYKCSSALPGDVNGDCVVDIFDLAKIGLCYSCSSVQGCWASCQQADLSRNNVVDIFDLANVGLNYGKSC